MISPCVRAGRNSVCVLVVVVVVVIVLIVLLGISVESVCVSLFAEELKVICMEKA